MFYYKFSVVAVCWQKNDYTDWFFLNKLERDNSEIILDWVMLVST